LTAIVDTWGAHYIKSTKAVIDGTWKAELRWDGLADGVLTMAPYTNMPDDVKKLAEDAEAKIKSGELKPFTGPVKKQDGTVWLKDGEAADLGVLAGLNFYVEGVDDKLPQ
jgi:simple sugar transport system substrate-binding protein